MVLHPTCDAGTGATWMNAAQSSEVHNNVAVEDKADEMETESQRRQDYLRDPLGECSDPDLYG